MSERTQMASLVSIDCHYRRSIKLDNDFGNPSALGAYICNRSARAVVETIARQISDGHQYAFTITGPYGGGKSSLALVLASTIQDDEELRKRALQRLDMETKALLKVAFPFEKGRLVIPVSGSKTNAVRLIGVRLNEVTGKKQLDPAFASASETIKVLIENAKSQKHDGLVLIIDELGKLLEAAAEGDGDINFFQDLAEASARSDGRLVVIGVLHQAFQQYVGRLRGNFRTEWAKVQGRFVDIPLVAGADEVVNLIGKAIYSKIEHPWSAGQSSLVAKILRKNRPALSEEIEASLDDCWPMHPAMAVLLGPFSRRQFGQNERSVFGFLSTVEPHGFRHYLENSSNPKTTSYRPSNFWDYLKANLEPAILSSTDAHRWAQADEAVSKVESRGDQQLVDLIKNLAVIDLFKSGSGVEATESILQSVCNGLTHQELSENLKKLAGLRVAAYRKHRGAWAIFEGSDFDIDEEIQKVINLDERSPIVLVKQYIQLHPVMAKRHYYEKGSLRWMNVVVCDEDSIKEIRDDRASLGTFAVCLFSETVKQSKAKKIACMYATEATIPGVSVDSGKLLESARELAALKTISQTNHQLVGDAVARKEVNSRLLAIQAGLEETVNRLIQKAEWCVDGEWVQVRSLSILASSVADKKFSNALRLINELLNREAISSNAVKARRELLYKMLRNEAEADLGLTGWPAERGLYQSILLDSGLHREIEDEVWGFSAPICGDPLNCQPLWRLLDSTLNDVDLVNIGALYDSCKSAPFGVKAGLLPILFFAYLMANKNSVAIYKDHMFVPQLSEADIDEFLKSPARFELRKVVIDDARVQQIKKYVDVLNELGRPVTDATPLSIARGLVSLAFQLPEWTRRTRKLSDSAIKLRDLLLRASDPHKLLFIDIPEQITGKQAGCISSAASAALAELVRGYPVLLYSIEQKMLEYMEALPLDLSALHKRAEAVDGVSGDFRLNAFASRVKAYDGSLERLEGILSLAANKPPKMWSDSDIDNALLELTGWATKFRQVEALASVQGRVPTREAFAVVIGSAGATKSLMKNFDISNEDKTTANEIARNIVEIFKEKGAAGNIALAALALAGVEIAEVADE